MSAVCSTPSRKYPSGRTGTDAGYQWHRKYGDEPCESCATAHIAKCRARWPSLSPEQREQRRAENRLERARHVADHPEKAQQAKERYMKKNRAIIRAAKEQPCADCGQRYPYYVMQFDHVRGVKLFNVGVVGPAAGRKVLIDEMAKCEVVCANCHAERTWQRLQEMKTNEEIMELPLEAV